MPKRRTEFAVAHAALLFAALGDETRLSLLRQLAEGPASISLLARNFDVSRQAVTKHLQFLNTAGLIEGTREGREHVWTLNPARLAQAQQALDLIASGWDSALTRLKKQIEAT